MDIHHRLKELSKFLSDYSTSLMAVGVHSSRIVKTTSRIAESFGFYVDMTIFQKTIIMTLRDKDNTHSYSTVNKIKSMALNFEINSRLSSLSWEAYDEHLSLDELKEKYTEILNKPRLNKWLVLFLVACANASFCRLFTGDWSAMLLVFIATLVGFFVRQQLMERHFNHMFVFVFSAFTASMIACTSLLYHIGNTPEIALGTSVLYLIPGVPLINGVIDIIEGHVLAGTSRLINAALLIICIAIGLSLTLLLFGVETL
ncbi:threonine/serine ThrE exporter family protein [Bacteroides sedimenti]|uniref:Threonine/serine exporter-like N-terminal domain-containing protein n=1 Tax=Bacteroides sedimenti TaxID=2136147 RepID=A0ABM8IFB7_9BACE